MPENPSSDRSIDRALKSTLAMADVLVEEGVKIVPGGELGYKLAKVLGRHAKNFILGRTEHRLEEFHTLLLNGIPVESQDSFLKTDFSIEDYSSILLHVTQDEEDAKVAFYAKMLQGLILLQIPAREKTHIIKAARNLTVWEFEKMRAMYIRDKYELIGCYGKKGQLKSVSMAHDSLDASSLEKLISLGFLTREEDFLRPTALLRTIVEISFAPERLTPASEGYKEKTLASVNTVLLIASDELLDPNLRRLEERLRAEDIGNQTIRVDRPLPKQLEMGILAFGVCITSKGTLMENVKNFIPVGDRPLFQIKLSGAAAETPISQGNPLVDLSGTTDLERGISAFVGVLKNLINRG
jgi:hypothetical protein